MEKFRWKGQNFQPLKEIQRLEEKERSIIFGNVVPKNLVHSSQIDRMSHAASPRYTDRCPHGIWRVCALEEFIHLYHLRKKVNTHPPDSRRPIFEYWHGD